MTDSRYWVVDDVNEHDGNTPLKWLADGVLCGIVDEDQGGIVAYCHRDNVSRVLALFVNGEGS